MVVSALERAQLGKHPGTPQWHLTRGPSHGPPEAAPSGRGKSVDGGQRGSDHQTLVPVGPRQSTSSLKRLPGHELPFCPSREDPAVEGRVGYPREGSGVSTQLAAVVHGAHG